jgi:alcohol dehydrogenase (cytochrome c)
MRAHAAALLLAATPALAQVPFQRIVDGRKEPANWLTYSGDYSGQRHSPLRQIHKGNIAALQPAWVYQSREAGKIETSPLAIDGIVYITEKPHIVTALDGRTGRPVWTYRRPEPRDVPGCCGPVNRGLAVLGDTLFHCTYDNHLVALDLHTGKERWARKIADQGTGHSMTAAPLAVKDKVIVGIGGGEFGIRGFLDAYDAATGERAWRFWTVPGPGEPGHDTWEGESWQTGGAGTWITGSYDPTQNLIFWGTGNPSPDYNGDDREGDNLYSNSLVALDADTGRLRWHFQYTPHDLHDWDSNQVPVLLEGVVAGRARKLVVQGNRNGFYYVLDRETGEFLSGTAYTKQTWASGLDARGRPVRLPNTAPSAAGTTVYPGLAGGTNWFSPAYSPLTRLFYMQTRADYSQVFYKLKPEYQPGRHFEGGGTRDVEGEQHGALKAFDAVTGRLRWEFPLHAPPSGGVLSTAGGILFTSSREGYVIALDATTGRALWRFNTGGQIHANPVTFEVAGKQHVAIAAGQSIFAFALSQGGTGTRAHPPTLALRPRALAPE